MTRSLFIATITLGLVFASCTPQKEKTEDVIAANKALDARYLSAYLQNNIDSLMSCYLNSPATFEIQSDGMLQGHDAIRAYYTNFFSQMTILEGKILESGHKVLDGGVVGHGTFMVKVRMPDGMEHEMKGYFMDLREKQNGKWYFSGNTVVMAQP